MINCKGVDVMKQNYYKTLLLFSYIFISILYLEILLKMRVLTLNFNGDFLKIILFSLSYSVLILFVLKFFKEKTIKISLYVLISFTSFLYLNQDIYCSFPFGVFSIGLLADVNKALGFSDNYLLAIRLGHIFYLVPIVTFYILRRFKILNVNISYDGLKQPLFFLIFSLSLYFISVTTIDETLENSDVDITYTDMDLYTYMFSPQEALKKFGLLTYSQRDFFSLFRTDPLSENEYAILLDDYFSEQPEHLANTYTDILKDKNLILIMAESLDTFAINEQLTPNLYNLKENYGYFENYYSPLYYRSTADTEFLVQTSMYPDKNVTLSMQSFINNTLPNTLPKLFEQKDYSTFSFHNYTDYFYPRSTFHRETLGYDLYMGSEELGLLDNPDPGQIVNNHVWQSDLEMMEISLPYFINEDQFFVNMVTVSGHFKYNDSHRIAQLHEDEVAQYEIDQGINLPEEIFWYLAANMELDLAIGYLMDELEAANKLDDTVIMIFGDHYAYGVDNDTIWEYDDMKIDDDDMDLHNVPLIVFSNQVDPVHPEINMFSKIFDNYMSSVDFIPTISNLFGLNLNYQQVFGKDALANTDNFVRFADMSFISKNYSYDSMSEQYVIIDDAVTPSYLLSINQRLINDYMYNVYALEYNYFKDDDE